MDYETRDLPPRVQAWLEERWKLLDELAARSAGDFGDVSFVGVPVSPELDCAIARARRSLAAIAVDPYMWRSAGSDWSCIADELRELDLDLRIARLQHLVASFVIRFRLVGGAFLDDPGATIERDLLVWSDGVDELLKWLGIQGVRDEDRALWCEAVLHLFAEGDDVELRRTSGTSPVNWRVVFEHPVTKREREPREQLARVLRAVHRDLKRLEAGGAPTTRVAEKARVHLDKEKLHELPSSALDAETNASWIDELAEVDSIRLHLYAAARSQKERKAITLALKHGCLAEACAAAGVREKDARNLRERVRRRAARAGLGR